MTDPTVARLTFKAAVGHEPSPRELATVMAAYLDRLPARTLATVNLMSLFGLHRRLRGAIVGHLALFEMTSSLPNARYARGIRRLGFADPAATDFFDEHVEADAVHEQLVRRDVIAPLVAAEPALAADVVFGMRASTMLGDRFGEFLLDRWASGRSSLRTPLPDAPLAVHR